MVKVLAHNGVERIGKSRQISDLLEVATMTRNEKWDGYDFCGSTIGQSSDGILESRLARFLPH